MSCGSCHEKLSLFGNILSSSPPEKKEIWKKQRNKISFNNCKSCVVCGFNSKVLSLAIVTTTSGVFFENCCRFGKTSSLSGCIRMRFGMAYTKPNARVKINIPKNFGILIIQRISGNTQRYVYLHVGWYFGKRH